MNGNCPICSKERKVKDNEHFPFCCEKCKMVDLYNWFDEKYYFDDDAIKEKEEE